MHLDTLLTTMRWHSCGFSMNLLNNLTLWQIFGLILNIYLKDPRIYLYSVALKNSSFISFLNFPPVSSGVTTALQLLILNIFKISWAYFTWHRNTHSLVSLNSISNKYDKFPRPDILNSCISFDLTPSIYASPAPVISKSSTYKHIMTRMSLAALLTYTPCCEMHFEKPTLIRKISVILFQALEAYFKPYGAFLNLYTSDSYPLILNPGGWMT